MVLFPRRHNFTREQVVNPKTGATLMARIVAVGSRIREGLLIAQKIRIRVLGNYG